MIFGFIKYRYAIKLVPTQREGNNADEMGDICIYSLKSGLLLSTHAS